MQAFFSYDIDIAAECFSLYTTLLPHVDTLDTVPEAPVYTTPDTTVLKM